MSERKIGKAVLSFDNVSITFGAVTALTDVSFAVHKHEIVAIIGPNGAGKTTALNVINGVYQPTQGTITYKGEKRNRMRPHQAASQGIARTFQNVALFKGFSQDPTQCFYFGNLKVGENDTTQSAGAGTVFG